MNIVLLDDEDEMLSAIRTQQPDYAFYGGLGLADDGTWRDVMRGVVATSAARPTIGTSNGRRAASFNGTTQLLRTAAFVAEIAQPYAIMSVSHRTGDASAIRYIHDGIGSSNRAALYTAATTGNLAAYGGASLASTTATTSPAVITVLGGASGAIILNGTTIASGNVGTQAMTGLSLGCTYTGASTLLPGLIALLVIISGTNYAARAEYIARAARRWYKTG